MRRTDRQGQTIYQLICLGLLALFITGGHSGGVIPPAAALTAEETLADPALEERARALSKQLRCLVCQNQSIDDSDADLAKDLRREVRARLQTGASDKEILDAIQQTYGDYVLLKPPVSQQTWLLWLAPLLILAGGVMMIALYLRRSARWSKTVNMPADAAEGQTHVPTKTKGQQAGSDRVPPGYVIMAGILMLAAAGLFYSGFGRPDLPDQPLRERAAELAERDAEAAAEKEALRAAFAAAEQAATDQPDNIDAWLSLALAAARRGDAQTEIKALTAALELTDGAAEIKAMLAEAMSRAAGGQVTVPARQLINEILAVVPDEPRALFLFGLAAYQDEAFQTAIDRWLYLYSLSGADAPWLATLEENIRRAAEDGGLKMPDLAAVRAEQAEERERPDQQQEMIEQMVAGLAARLQAEPDDRDGWLRLARSYQVLGRVEAQIEALFAAAALEPADDELVIYLSEVILQSDQSAIYAGRIGGVLDTLQAEAKTNPQWQFFRGHFALTDGKVKLAREHWAALLASLPAGSELAQLLQQRLADLPE